MLILMVDEGGSDVFRYLVVSLGVVLDVSVDVFISLVEEGVRDIVD